MDVHSFPEGYVDVGQGANANSGSGSYLFGNRYRVNPNIDEITLAGETPGYGGRTNFEHLQVQYRKLSSAVRDDIADPMNKGYRLPKDISRLTRVGDTLKEVRRGTSDETFNNLLDQTITYNERVGRTGQDNIRTDTLRNIRARYESGQLNNQVGNPRGSPYTRGAISTVSTVPSTLSLSPITTMSSSPKTSSLSSSPSTKQPSSQKSGSKSNSVKNISSGISTVKTKSNKSSNPSLSISSLSTPTPTPRPSITPSSKSSITSETSPSLIPSITSTPSYKSTSTSIPSITKTPSTLPLPYLLPGNGLGQKQENKRGAYSFKEISPTWTPGEMGRALFTGSFTKSPKSRKLRLIKGGNKK
jgi:hypothetical protein